MSAEAQRTATGAAVAGQDVPATRTRSAPAGRRRARRAGGYVFLIALCSVMMFPFVWMLLTSVRPRDTVFSGGILPHSITLSAYGRAWSQIHYFSHFLSSVLITVPVVLGVVALATLAGYSFAKLDFPGK